MSDNKTENMTISDILSAIRQLPSSEKLSLIRILTEELESAKPILFFEQNKKYSMPTPYNTFGAGEILMNVLKESDSIVENKGKRLA